MPKSRKKALKELDAIAAKSRLSAADALKIGAKIRKGIARRYGLSKQGR